MYCFLIKKKLQKNIQHEHLTFLLINLKVRMLGTAEYGTSALNLINHLLVSLNEHSHLVKFQLHNFSRSKNKRAICCLTSEIKEISYFQPAKDVNSINKYIYWKLL